MKTYYPPISDKKGNDLKTFVQLDVGEKVFQDHQLILEGVTGFGKSKAAIRSFERANPTSTLVIVPTLDLQAQWRSQIDAEVIVINSHVFHPGDKKHWGMVIVDEGHKVLNEASQWFSTALDLFTSDYFLIMSATFSKSHFEFLRKKRPNANLYKVPLSWAMKNKLVPEHLHVNIPVDLTLPEKSAIIKAQTEYDKYSRYFATYNIFNPFTDYSELDFIAKDGTAGNKTKEQRSDNDKGQLIGMMNKWRKATNDRKGVYYKAVNKRYILQDFLNRVRVEKPQKCLIFGKSIDYIEQCAGENEGAVAYHSECNAAQKKDVFTKFFTDECPFLISIGKIIEGFDMEAYAKVLKLENVSTSCQLAFRLAYDSNELKTIQGFGRVLRYNPANPEQRVVQVNLYCNDFSIRGKEYKSQEKKWLIENLKSQLSIVWLNDVNEIEL